jgi:rhodanese-related sulfurtransferase
LILPLVRVHYEVMLVDHAILALIVAATVAIAITCRARLQTRPLAFPLLILASVIAALLAHSLTSVGYFRSQPRYDRVQHIHRASFLPRLSSQQAVDLAFQQKARFIDARDRTAYEQWHIQGAIHLPPAMPAALRSNMIGPIDKQTPLVIYCDSSTCSLDQLLATELLDNGFTRIYLLHRVRASVVVIDRLLQPQYQTRP